MARRRKQKLVEENHERWLVSYADFITLLFAFFVVMYSISSVNEGKYRVLTDTLSDVFGERRAHGGGQMILQPGEPVRDLVALPEPFPIMQSKPPDDELATQAQLAMQRVLSQQQLFDELAISLDSYIDNGLIDLRMRGQSIEVDMQARMLFPSAAAQISEAAMQALRQVTQSLRRIPNRIQVEGHTDTVPIANFLYRSNWELSAARAASVVEYLQGLGVDPQRLAAVGMGEHSPIAENDTEEGRARNRRVTLLILDSEPQLDQVLEDAIRAEGQASGTSPQVRSVPAEPR